MLQWYSDIMLMGYLISMEQGNTRLAAMYARMCTLANIELERRGTVANLRHVSDIEREGRKPQGLRFPPASEDVPKA